MSISNFVKNIIALGIPSAKTNAATGTVDIYVNGKDVLQRSGAVQPWKAAFKLKYFYKALYLGSTMAGITLTRPKNVIRVGVFGDSVGNSKPVHITNLLKSALNAAGGFYNTVYPNNGASVISNVNVGTTWITGSYFSLPAGGDIVFQNGGGRPVTTKIKVFYVKEPGAGTFKLQTRNDNGAYVDEVGYLTVDASNATTALGVITLTKAFGQWDMKAIGITGTIKIIHATYEDQTNGGVAVYNFDTGGLPLSTAMQTPSAIKIGIMNEIGLDTCFMEFKDGPEFSGAFSDFMGWYKSSVTKPADWVFIGTTPEQVESTAGSTDAITNNAVMSTYSDTNGHIYFDGYSPLVNWGMMVALGWGGDGTHPAAAAQIYLASILWNYLGFDSLIDVPSGAPIRTTKKVELADLATLEFNRDGITAAKLQASSDLELFSARGYLFKDSAGNIQNFISGSGGQSNAFNRLGFGAPFAANLPTVFPFGTAGLYLTNGAQNSTPTVWMGAVSYKVGSSLGGPEIFAGVGTPEGVKTAPVGSVFLRSDGGAGTTYYVKESGTGNTGWVAK